MQRLILPINKCTVTAGYRNKLYKSKFGFEHYGVDLIGAHEIYACGSGIVLAVGYDSIFGNTVIIKYPSVYIHDSGKMQDIVARCYHLSDIKVIKGQAVSKDTIIGIIGSTGKYSCGVHLHIEFDTDTVNYNYTAGLAIDGTLIKAGNANTIISPANVLYLKCTAPDNQTIKRIDDYANDSDISLPDYPTETAGKQASGDINGDGVVDIQDVVQARADIIGNSKLRDKQAMAADMDGSGTVDVQDVVKIRNKITNKFKAGN